MKELFEIIETLIEDNKYICDYIDSNIALINDNDIDSINNSMSDFYRFMNGYGERNNRFKVLMNSLNYKSVWEIEANEYYDKVSLKKFLKTFEESVVTSQKKLSLYGQLISSELNMINKIKHFKRSGNIDFKL